METYRECIQRHIENAYRDWDMRHRRQGRGPGKGVEENWPVYYSPNYHRIIKVSTATYQSEIIAMMCEFHVCMYVKKIEMPLQETNFNL